MPAAGARNPARDDALLAPAEDFGRGVDRRLPVVPQIYDALRDAIVRVALRPGQAVSETEMAARFGVSRTPIREALIRLADEGLIDIYPQAGTFVSRIDLGAVREAQFVRETLETAAAIQAASTNAGVSAFEPILERQERAIRDGDFPEFFASDEDLHRKVFELSGHGPTWRLVQSAKSHLDRVRQLDRPPEATLLEMLRQHRLIVGAIRAGDVAAVTDAIREHASVILKVAPDVASRHPDLFRE
jgi:GntR family transcriptional regulator, rspAB operon transcriptional repressor